MLINDIYFRNRYGESLERTPCYEACTTISDSQLEKRLSSIDTEIPFPTELFKNHAVRSSRSGFPILDSVTLNQEPVQRSSSI